MTPFARCLTGGLLFGLVVAGTPTCAQQRDPEPQETSAAFDLEDVEPFLTRVAALIDSGFTVADVKALAAATAKQALEAEVEHEYRVVSRGVRTTLRIVVFMDDVEAPDIAFFTHPSLATRIDAAIAKYFADVGK